MKKKVLYYIFLVLILVDIAYTFSQNYNAEIDGDIAESVLPLDYIKPVLSDPLGINAFVFHQHYVAPNRFLSHFLYNRYMNSMPFFLQHFSSPIDSVYLSCAIMKTIIHIFLIFLIAGFSCGGFKIKDNKFLLSFLITSSLFQTCGYTRDMGIIDPAITYTFFYALPLLFLCVFLLPFVFKVFYKKSLIKNKVIFVLFYVFFAFLVCFSGATNPAIALVLSFVILLKQFIAKYNENNNGLSFFNRIIISIKSIERLYYIYLLPLCLLSLYSLYIGSFNTMFEGMGISLGDRYKLLPTGLYKLFFDNKGFTLLLAICIINTIIIRIWHKQDNGKKITSFFSWILIYSLIYILLLPIGGYRYYRPYIIRYDTIISISFALITYFTYSSLFLINNTKKIMNKIFLYSFLTTVIVFFTIKDDPAYWRDDCERKMLTYISQSKDKVVVLPENCNIMSWNAIQKPEDSKNVSLLLYRWHITKDMKLFYYKDNNIKQ
jgi:hypothetical protein